MIWAAVDILSGECVQLRGGDPLTARFNRDPVQAALHWASQGAGGIHIVDLDRALGKGSNRDIIEQIVTAINIPIQLGGGIREIDEISDWLNKGVQRIITGTKALTNPDWLEQITALFPVRIVLALETEQGKIATDGWTKRSEADLIDFARSVDHLPLAAFLHTNIDVEGSEAGIEEDSIRSLCSSVKTPVMISGGIGSPFDVQNALSMGAEGVVIGTALYSGNIDLTTIIEERANAG